MKKIALCFLVMVLTGSCYAAKVDLRQECVLCLRMNDNVAADKTVTDSSGNGNNGTANKSTGLLSVSGLLTTAFDINVTNYINLNNAYQSTIRGGFALNFWVKLTDGQYTQSQFLFGVDNDLGNWFEVSIVGSGQIYIQFRDSTNEVQPEYVTDAAVFTNGANGWTMITVNYWQVNTDPPAGQLGCAVYKNGVAVAGTWTQDDGFGVLNHYTSVLPFYLGANNHSGADRPIYGEIDCSALFNRPLTQGEIDFLYGSGDGTESLAGGEVDLTDACVFQFKMNDKDEESLAVFDSQGGTSATATFSTGSNTTAGKVGGALSFNGTTDYVDTGQTFQLTFRDSFSINFWIGFNDGQPAVYKYLFGSEDLVSYDTVYAFLNIEGSLHFAYGAGGVPVFVDTSVLFDNGSNSWSMLTFIVTNIDSTHINLKVYKDATIGIDTNLETIASMSTFTTSELFPIGAVNTDSMVSGFMNGSLDNVMIFNKALSENEIRYLYHNGYGTEKLTPVSMWQDLKNRYRRWVGYRER